MAAVGTVISRRPHTEPQLIPDYVFCTGLNLTFSVYSTVHKKVYIILYRQNKRKDMVVECNILVSYLKVT